jgi:hypothetical protein
MSQEAVPNPKEGYTEEEFDETLELIMEAYSSLNDVLESDCMVYRYFATQLLATMNEKFKEVTAFLMEDSKLTLAQLTEAALENKSERGVLLRQKSEEMMAEIKKGTELIEKNIPLPPKPSDTAKARKRMAKKPRKNRRKMD